MMVEVEHNVGFNEFLFIKTKKYVTLKTLKEEEIIELCFNDRYMSDLENKERTTEEESLFKILSEERQRQWTRLEAIEKRIDRVLLGQDKIDQDCRDIAQNQQKIAQDQQKIAREFSLNKSKMIHCFINNGIYSSSNLDAQKQEIITINLNLNYRF
ncbi:hypothetical protein IIV31_109R [Armadillidium vulgare iridescent virus]|uniref:Uncharacterized protein n=1 Tax=Armadillidium vulgare iridescent virus TaxID=72201 RepID=A0A068QKI5_9VIRU|nr:hypothetical protein IIV31_109R [Armadillidium vulgare iridescent virus]CCV02481.1 hypothetical protein IIV31_109R [Armadillidium vulgare iridescent virus]